MTNQDKGLSEFTGGERMAVFLANWSLLLLAPVWAPIAFWRYAITGPKFIRNLFTGKGFVGK